MQDESGVSAQPVLPGVKPASLPSLGIMRTLRIHYSRVHLSHLNGHVDNLQTLVQVMQKDSAWIKVPAALLRPTQTSLLFYTGVLLLA